MARLGLEARSGSRFEQHPLPSPFSKFLPCGELVLFSSNIVHFSKKFFLSEKYLARACSFTVDCCGFSRSLLRIPRVERIPRVNVLAESLKCPNYLHHMV